VPRVLIRDAGWLPAALGVDGSRQRGGEDCNREVSNMKAIVVTEQAAGTAGMKLSERPEPPAAINDVIVQIDASGFVPTEMEWPSTWTDRAGRDRTPSIAGHELAGMVTALGYGTRAVLLPSWISQPRGQGGEWPIGPPRNRDTKANG
jgi:hypothetical protein